MAGYCGCYRRLRGDLSRAALHVLIDSIYVYVNPARPCGNQPTDTFVYYPANPGDKSLDHLVGTSRNMHNVEGVNRCKYLHMIMLHPMA